MVDGWCVVYACVPILAPTGCSRLNNRSPQLNIQHIKERLRREVSGREGERKGGGGSKWIRIKP